MSCSLCWCVKRCEEHSGQCAVSLCPFLTIQACLMECAFRLSWASSLDQSSSAYRLLTAPWIVLQMPEEAEEGAALKEEDAADVAARRKAEAKAREEAELRKRSQVPPSNLHTWTHCKDSIRVKPNQNIDMCLDLDPRQGGRSKDFKCGVWLPMYRCFNAHYHALSPLTMHQSPAPAAMLAPCLRRMRQRRSFSVR